MNMIAFHIMFSVLIPQQQDFFQEIGENGQKKKKRKDRRKNRTKQQEIKQ